MRNENHVVVAILVAALANCAHEKRESRLGVPRELLHKLQSKEEDASATVFHLRSLREYSLGNREIWTVIPYLSSSNRYVFDEAYSLVRFYSNRDLDSQFRTLVLGGNGRSAAIIACDQGRNRSNIEFIDLLKQRLSRENDGIELRQMIVNTIYCSHVEELVPIYITQLDNSDIMVRYAASRALMRIARRKFSYNYRGDVIDREKGKVEIVEWRTKSKGILPLTQYEMSIGISFKMEEDCARVVEVNSICPAGKSGIEKGACIVAINGESVSGKFGEELREYELAAEYITSITFELLSENGDHENVTIVKEECVHENSFVSEGESL